MKANEKATVELAKNGDVNAFGKLVKDHHKKVYFTILKYIRNPEVTEDIVQNSFLDAWKHIKKFEGRSSFFTWITRIAINNAKKTLISQHNNPEKVNINDIKISRKPQIIKKIISKERGKVLSEAINKLTPRQQIILNLRIHEDLTFREIGEIIGCATTSAKSHYHHIKNILKEEIKTSYK